MSQSAMPEFWAHGNHEATATRSGSATGLAATGRSATPTLHLGSPNLDASGSVWSAGYAAGIDAVLGRMTTTASAAELSAPVGDFFADDSLQRPAIHRPVASLRVDVPFNAATSGGERALNLFGGGNVPVQSLNPLRPASADPWAVDAATAFGRTSFALGPASLTAKGAPASHRFPQISVDLPRAPLSARPMHTSVNHLGHSGHPVSRGENLQMPPSMSRSMSMNLAMPGLLGTTDVLHQSNSGPSGLSLPGTPIAGPLTDLASARLASATKKAVTPTPEDPKRASLYKTELCRSFEESGSCRYGAKCQFAHGQAELRTVMRHPRYKTEICKTFHTIGTCPYGRRCRFIHNEPITTPSGSTTTLYKAALTNDVAEFSLSNKVDQKDAIDSYFASLHDGEAESVLLTPTALTTDFVNRARKLPGSGTPRPGESGSAAVEGAAIVNSPARPSTAFDRSSSDEERGQSNDLIGVRSMDMLDIAPRRLPIFKNLDPLLHGEA